MKKIILGFFLLCSIGYAAVIPGTIPNYSATTSCNVTTASTLVLAADRYRAYACIVNDSAVVVYLSLGNAAVTNRGIRLNANGGSYEITNDNLWQGAIYAKTTPNASLTVQVLRRYN